jgi:hypothetical protein
MRNSGRVALGSLAGVALAGLIAPRIRPLFRPVTGGVGALTVAGYPKSWDYAVVALLIGLAFAGGAVAAFFASPDPELEIVRVSRMRAAWITAIVVFVLMIFMHDMPYALIEPFHEGEHLTAGWLMRSGEHPYRDFFIFHGLAADAALDALVLGDPPSPLHVRRQQTILDALTLALLVPIALELTTTTVGMIAGVVASLCAIAALWLPLFPFYRLLPLHVAVLALLRFQRTRRGLWIACAASTLGVLWSLDTGMYALVSVAICAVVLRPPLRQALMSIAVALALPLLVLLIARADIRQFFIDSFIIMPRAIDAIWSLPAPAKPFTAEGLRYYAPPAFYGFLFALAFLAWRRRSPALAGRLVIVAIFSVLLFRTASGRVSWAHTRFSMPLLGVAVVAFVIEPLFRRRQWIAALLVIAPLFLYFEIAQNFVAGAKLLAGWRARQRHEGLVHYPFASGKGIYATPQNASELAALNGILEPGTILDLSNERALYYLLQRRAPIRCMEISMLSVPRLYDEAITQLNAHPPVAVILEGFPEVMRYDGLSNRDRVPALAAWIDAHYPNRRRIGRFLVALP